jgi:hypothetical protein
MLGGPIRDTWRTVNASRSDTRVGVPGSRRLRGCSNCGQAAGTGLSAAVRGGCCVKASEKLPNLTGRRRIGFVALARVSSHLPATWPAPNTGRSITDRHTGSVSGLCNSRAGSGRPSDPPTPCAAPLVETSCYGVAHRRRGAARRGRRRAGRRQPARRAARGSARRPDRLAVCRVGARIAGRAG